MFFRVAFFRFFLRRILPCAIYCALLFFLTLTGQLHAALYRVRVPRERVPRVGVCCGCGCGFFGGGRGSRRRCRLGGIVCFAVQARRCRRRGRRVRRRRR